MLLRLIFSLLLLIIVALGSAVYLMLETAPRVTTKSAQQVGQADTVNHLLAQIKDSVKDRYEQHTINISRDQIDSLMGFVQRAVPRIRASVEMDASATALKATLVLPTPLEGYFVNVETQVLPGDQVHIDYVQLGGLKLPGEFTLRTLVWLVDWWTKSTIASQAVEQITRVTMDERGIELDMQPLDALLVEFNNVKNGLNVEQDEELRQMTAYYLRYLHEQSAARKYDPQSMVSFLRPLMKKAFERSDETTAVRHNEAAILALAIYAGHHRIANLVGEVQPDPQRALLPNAPVVLAGRNDLARHFIISAALQLYSKHDVSLAIGEFKELMDRVLGGSGYSFVDLAADMAGIRFAEVAVDPLTARSLQVAISEAANEKVFFPPINNLPEGLSKIEFERRFTEVDSPAYRAEVNKIKRRVKAIPLYQTN